jgi:enamine deaminase RidA (YjgF/YER057c/UK114 family)
MVRMTWYVVDRADYLARGRDIGAVYREVMGHYDVAMSAVEVSALMEARAKVEIEVTAVVPRDGGSPAAG